MKHGYKYLIPLVSVAPPPGYTLKQMLSLSSFTERLDRPDADLTISRLLIRDGKEIDSTSETFQLRDGKWNQDETYYSTDALADDAWEDGGLLAYLETHFTVDGEAVFESQFSPPFYTVYSSPDRKTFLSDNALKYGNTVTIYQVQAFGAWVEGYPAAAYDPSRDAAESLVLINPFNKAAVANIHLDDRLDKPKRVRIDALSGVRLELSKLFDFGGKPWNGHVFVAGRNRLVMYVAKHSMSDPCEITTVEHSNPYRGEPTHIPATRDLRRRVGEYVMDKMRAHG